MQEGTEARAERRRCQCLQSQYQPRILSFTCSVLLRARYLPIVISQQPHFTEEKTEAQREHAGDFSVWLELEKNTKNVFVFFFFLLVFLVVDTISLFTEVI